MLSKIIHIGEKRPNSEPELCKHSFTLRKKFTTKMSDRDKHIIIAKNIILPKSREGKKVFEAREQQRQVSGEEGLEKEAASVMIVSTAPNKESKSRQRKREMEEGSPSAEAVSVAKLKETHPMVLARWKTAA